MQDEEKEVIINWCKETFGEYYLKDSYNHGLSYHKRNFSLQEHYQGSLSDFSRDFAWYRDYFFFYPFNNFTLPNTIDSTEEFFLKGSYTGRYVKIISVNLEYGYIYLHEVKVKYQHELDYLINIVNSSKEKFKYLTKVTLEEVQNYEEQIRKKEWDKVQQASIDKRVKKMENDKSKRFYNFFSILSLILFILALLMINWSN